MKHFGSFAVLAIGIALIILSYCVGGIHPPFLFNLTKYVGYFMAGGAFVFGFKGVRMFLPKGF